MTAPQTIYVVGHNKTLPWVLTGAAFSTESEAKAACIDANYFYGAVTFPKGDPLQLGPPMTKEEMDEITG